MTALIVSLAATLVLQTESNSPRMFTSRTGGFQVELPGTPSERVLKVETAAGPIDTHLFVVDRKDHVFLVSYNDYPESLLNDDPRTVLERARLGAIANVRGSLVSKQDIEVHGHPSQDFEFQVSTTEGVTSRGRARLVLVERRLYQLILLGPPETVSSRESDRFLQSFTLTSAP